MIKPDRLGSVREMIEAHGLWADKGFGQHFLFDLNITHKIAKQAGSLEQEWVIEVGPGPGGLTRALLDMPLKGLIAIEMDQRLTKLLSELREFYDERLICTFGDALKVSEAELLQQFTGQIKAHIFSNLPYNIGTALLIKWLTGPWKPLSMTLMFQKEVAQRITATVGDEHYGRLSILCALTGTTDRRLDLPPQAFTPAPKVHSRVLHIVPKTDQALSPIEIKTLETITQAAFGQRRKMLKTTLKAFNSNSLLDKINIDEKCRAEELNPNDYLRLVRAVVNLNSHLSQAPLA
jgi:16S rRNA (adenine1518-N6/adenine1519-N6)-dimethyltransferase